MTLAQMIFATIMSLMCLVWSFAAGYDIIKRDKLQALSQMFIGGIIACMFMSGFLFGYLMANI